MKGSEQAEGEGVTGEAETFPHTPPLVVIDTRTTHPHVNKGDCPEQPHTRATPAHINITSDAVIAIHGYVPSQVGFLRSLETQKFAK